jgi:TPR repeat protein
MKRLVFLVSCAIVVVSLTGFVQQAVAQQESASTPRLSPEQIAQLQAKADAGNSDAQVSLGRAYEDGDGVPQSDRLAVSWYKAAAEQGNAKAQNNLGLMFRSGLGVDQDKAEAVRWYGKAAKQGNPNAMFNLGTAYYNGDGVAADEVASFAWLLLAQQFGSVSADGATKRMKDEAGNRESEALEKIGGMYQKGDELPQRSSEAINWYRKATENGDGRVQIKLASLLLQNPNGTTNYAEARRLCEGAAGLHYSPGAYCMGQIYDHGWGVERNLSEAAKWYSDAANMGLAVATLRVGEMYWKGEGLKQDKISAYEFIYLAASADIPEAKQESEMLEKELTRKEVKEAKAKAVEWSHQHAHLVLKEKTPTAN